MYKITEYSYKKAQDLKVQILPSTKKNKKIDVFKNGKFVCSIGDSRYGDFPTYVEQKGMEYAKIRRNLFHIRMKGKDIEGSPTYYALRILW